MQQPNSPPAPPLSQALQAAIRLHQSGQLREAEAAYRLALSQDPASPDALHGLGVLAYQAGQMEAAADLIGQAVARRPDSAEFVNNLGMALRDSGRLAESAAAHRRAIGLRPDDPEGYNNLGLALRDDAQWDAAEAAFRRAIALGPAAHYHNNLGNLLRHLERYDEAVAEFQTALRLRPDYAKAYSNLGTALQYGGRLGEALAAFRKAVEVEPGFAHGHFNRSLALLAAGDWAEGWTEYDWRWQCAEFRPLRRVVMQPEWDGSDPAGRIVLLTTEQGLGDVLQFARFAPLLARLGARVWLVCEPELAGLMRSVEGVERVVPGAGVASPLPAGFDMEVPLLSLPSRLGTTLPTLPATVPYLRPDPAKVAAWRERVGRDGAAGLRVGLVWGGKPIPDPRRSCGLAALAPLAGVPGVTFYSLQLGEFAQEAKTPPAGMMLVDPTADLRDFEDTAALILNLDLVVTIDSAVCHLAGALGKPTWALLRFAADWRWMAGRDDSPWYPTMRLFRQPSPGDWGPVVRRIVEELRAAAAGAKNLLPPPAALAAAAPAAPPPRPPGPQLRQRLNDLVDAAMAHMAAKKLPEAELACRQALDLQPAWPDALNTLGLVVQQFGRRGLAVDLMRRSIEANPGNANYRTNFGTVLAGQGRHKEAIAEFRAALRIDRSVPECHNNLGAALLFDGQLDDAAAEFREALRLRPNYPEALTSLGVVLTHKGRLADAAPLHRRAIELNSNYPNAHNNLGLTLLLGGDLAAGFAEYEWRWRTPEGSPFRRVFLQPQWCGEDVRGKTVLLHTEQGYGDAIQFARYAPLVAQRVGPGGRVLLECQAELAPLLGTVAGVNGIIPRGQDIPPFAVYAPLLSLPLTMGTTLATVPNRVPYLSPDPARAAAWGEKLAALAAGRGAGGRLKVGLVWAGNIFHRNDRNRSCGLGAMVPLAALSEAGRVVFFGLQIGSRAEEAKTPPAGMDLIDLSADLGDFGETAAVVANLDVVIAVDTAVCHLAGALGRPTWALLPFAPDWRWMLDRDDSPWYPTMRLFRQPAQGEWGPVLQRVAESLAQFADDRARGGAETARSPSPERLDHLNRLTREAMAHLAAGRVAEAERACRAALELEPDWPPALNTLGLVAHHSGRPAMALDLMNRSVAARPDDPEFRTHHGLVLAVQGDTAGAIDAFRAAARLKPDQPEIWNNLGVALTAAGQPAEATAAYREALRLWPAYPDAPPDPNDRKAVTAARRTANAHKNLGISLLLAGDLADGFGEYEWRWRAGEPTTVRQDFAQPRWGGEDIRGKTLLLQAEQGYGDAIQFARYIAAAAERVGPGGQIVLDCPLPVAVLLAGAAGVGRVVPRGEPLPPFDVHAPLLSLPAVFETMLDTIPNRVPYLKAEDAKAALWGAHLDAVSAGTAAAGAANRPLRIGLVWSGSESHPYLRRRSVPLAALAPLAEAARERGAVFFSLQVGPAAEQAKAPPDGMKLVDVTPGLRDFADTAAVISHLDLVISVDTAVCHLAGALGKPTWTLLMAVPDWRWMLGRDDSPWYPTMRLFRQPEAGEWGPVVAGMAEELKRFAPG